MFRRKARTPAAETSQPRARIRINWSMIGLILLVIAITVFAILLNQGQLSDAVVLYWPAAIAIPALIWLLVALVRRDVRGLLGSTVLFGLSVSLLLAAQGIPLSTTLVGVLFIAVGIGII